MHITTYRQDNETSWRTSRLCKAADTFCLIFGVTREQLDALIHSFHDHKGELHVEWHQPPTERQRELMAVAWRLCGESNVHHSVVIESI